MKIKIFFLFVMIAVVTQAQITITGFVLDEGNKEVLEGVSVFYDGTTIGTITNSEGYFTITTPKKLTAPLVISYIGFENQIYNNLETSSLGEVFLKESAVQLNEVVLKPDTWSREKKLGIFRRQFLGTTPPAVECKILNEDDVRLYYDKEKNILYGYANKPLQIRNKFLGYIVQYHLVDFEVRYHNSLSGFNMVESVFYAGTALFTEINEKVKRKYIKNRDMAYYGSVLHFMRALSKRRLYEEKFRIFKERQEVEPYLYLRVDNSTTDGNVKVEQIEERLNILYDKWGNSNITVIDSAFHIDAYGNHAPANNVLFGGDMGLLRIATVLPLDYQPKKESKRSNNN
tara:strand:+ start:1361 stop:2392 length:1032 start_codon:yes stop_codon:yes gene_type:complete